MSALDRIACCQDRRGQIPNQELARDLLQRRPGGHPGDRREPVEPRSQSPQRLPQGALRDRRLGPELVAPYAGDFLKLLRSRNNRPAAL